LLKIIPSPPDVTGQIQFRLPILLHARHSDSFSGMMNVHLPFIAAHLELK